MGFSLRFGAAVRDGDGNFHRRRNISVTQRTLRGNAILGDDGM